MVQFMKPLNYEDIQQMKTGYYPSTNILANNVYIEYPIIIWYNLTINSIKYQY